MCAVFDCVVFGHSAIVVCRLQVAVVLWLFLLFRVLSSTAENFFSPILTQLSQEMGLPPRFAGGMPHSLQQHLTIEGHQMAVPPCALWALHARLAGRASALSSACRVAVKAELCSAFA